MRIRGIVEPGGAHAGRARTGPWTVALSLRPWRREDGTLVDGTVLVWQT
ncbi:MAG: hypothetical protein IT378_24545, partial [Sandaracinaceae bacterium]|nr:hypothetical protein [Sandaracinaceae bacterium]